MKEKLKSLGNTIKKVLSALVDCIIPTMPIMIGVGMLNVVLIIFGPDVLNILSKTSNTYIVLSFVAQAGYYFMPIYIAVAAADVFKTDRFLSAVCGAMLVAPDFVKLVDEGRKLSVFGLPITPTYYGNQVISSIIIIWLMSYVCNLLNRILPESIRPLFFSVLTILIMTPIALCAVGPLGVFLGNKLVQLILMLKDLGPVGNGIMVAIIPFITTFGLGGANLSAMLLLASTGCDPILFFSNVLYNTILGVITFVLYMKTSHQPEALAYAITSFVGGTSEPCLFGYVLKDPMALAALCISGFLGGFFLLRSHGSQSLCHGILRYLRYPDNDRT